MIKAAMAGVLWLGVHVPLDIVLTNIKRTDISAFAVTVQVLDVIILGYLVFQILQYQRKRPWKCVVCDGFGIRHFGPGGVTVIGSPVCSACKGQGVIWETVASQ